MLDKQIKDQFDLTKYKTNFNLEKINLKNNQDHLNQKQNFSKIKEIRNLLEELDPLTYWDVLGEILDLQNG